MCCEQIGGPHPLDCECWECRAFKGSDEEREKRVQQYLKENDLLPNQKMNFNFEI